MSVTAYIKYRRNILSLIGIIIGFICSTIYAKHYLPLDVNLQTSFIKKNVFTFIAYSSLVSILPYLFSINYKKIRFEHIVYVALLILMIGTLFHPKFISKLMPVFAGLCVINLIIYRKITKPLPVLYFYLAAYSIYAIGLFWSNDLPAGKGLLETKLPMLMFPIVFCFFSLKNIDNAKTIMLIFFKASLIFILASLLCWLIQSMITQVLPLEWIVFQKKTIVDWVPVYKQIFAWSNYDHPSYISIALMVAFILGIYLFISNTKKIKPSFLEIAIFAISSLALIIISQSRIGIILWGVVVTYFTFILLPKRLKVPFIILAILAGSYGIYKKSNTYTKDPVREQQYKIALSFFNEKPLIGVGTGGIKQIMTSEENAKNVGYERLLEPETTYPHNQFIGEMLHLGILGLLALLLIIGPLTYIAIKNRNYLLGILIISYLLLMMIEMPIYHQRGTGAFFLFTTLFLYFNNLGIGVKSSQKLL